MTVSGLLDVARAGLAALVRMSAHLPLWLGEVLALTADLIDPAMPESIRRPREWLPRLWSRTGGRTPNEDRD